MTGLRLVSANDHLLEPPHLWKEHLPARWRDEAPVVVDDDDGVGQYWRFGAELVPVSRLATVAGEDPDSFRQPQPSRFEDLKRGSWDPVARLADMDRDGVERHACQPTVIGFAGTKLLDLADRDLALACVRAYNDFVIDEWCGVAPDRFISIVLAPMWDADLARDEVRRAIAKGAQAVAFVEDPTALGLPSYHSGYWNPMLAAIHEAGIPLCLHMNSPMVRMVQGADTPWGVHLTLMYCTSMATMVNLLFSPVFADFPRLKVVLPEGGLGWVPFMLEKADFLWDRHRGYCRGPATPAAPPSELYQGRIFSCIQSHDQAGIRERHAIGVEQILWQSDYPHADSTWPRSAELMVAQLGGVPAAEQELILGGNARRVFNLES